MMHPADYEPPEPVDAVDEALRRAAEEHAIADDDNGWHPLTCGYYFAFAEDADAMCDCGLVARSA